MDSEYTKCDFAYRVFSLTWTAYMQIYCNKRKRLHKKRVQLPGDWFETPTWPLFRCFGTPIWPPWRHVKTLYRCTYPQIMLKLVHSNFSGSQTHDLCLVVRLVHQRGQLKVLGSKSMHWICLETADINWLDVGGQCIRFSTAQQRWYFDIINILFLRSISCRSERSSRVMAVLISHQQPSVTCKYQNMCHSRSCVQHADRLFPTLRCLATKQSQLVTLLTRSKVCITKVKNVHSKYYKRLKNPLIIITSHNFNFNDHATELYKKDEF